MKINYELLRASVREHVATEAEDNLSQWCKQGKPILKQSTVHKFLAGVRGVGMGLFLALCERMNTKPSFFYSALTSDDLRDKLSLLSEMAADPIFPFGKEDLFYNLADQIDSLYHKYLEAKKTKVQ